MSKRKLLLPITFGTVFSCNFLSSFEMKAAEPSFPADKETTTKHFHFPFVHVDVAAHKNGTKDYDVRAPFTRVHNPAGSNNAEVKAPFYSADHKKTVSANNARRKSTASPKVTNKKSQT